jgi:hypothetical protein
MADDGSLDEQAARYFSGTPLVRPNASTVNLDSNEAQSGSVNSDQPPRTVNLDDDNNQS